MAFIIIILRKYLISVKCWTEVWNTNKTFCYQVSIHTKLKLLDLLRDMEKVTSAPTEKLQTFVTIETDMLTYRRRKLQLHLSKWMNFEVVAVIVRRPKKASRSYGSTSIKLKEAWSMMMVRRILYFWWRTLVSLTNDVLK